MNNILTSLKEKVLRGEITIKEAARRLHKAGWTNFVDVTTTKILLNI